MTYLKRYATKRDLLEVHGNALLTLSMFMYGTTYHGPAIADGFLTL